MTFDELRLHPQLLDGIDAMNFNTPTPIQEMAIPIILAGKDLIGVAQTGTGKTAAFTLPIIDRLLDMPPARHIQALILVPTRELAIQIDKAIEAYAYFTGTSSVAVYGGGDGKDFSREKTALTTGADIVIATPGRFISHLNMGYVDLSKIDFLVLDEADRMLDMGFQADLLRIIDRTNPKRQTLLFSATMPDTVAKLARKMMRNPEQISIALSKPAEGVSQGVYLVHEQQKTPLILKILQQHSGKSILVFSSTKQNVAQLYRSLKAKGLNVGQISSDLEQSEREKVMRDFSNRVVDILVATDVVSRGIDIDIIDVVINYDVPHDAEDYVHRVGRTARAARTGEAITLVSPAEKGKYHRIESLIGSEIPKLPLPEGLPKVSAEPPRQQAGGRRPAFKGKSKPQNRSNNPLPRKKP